MTLPNPHLNAIKADFTDIYRSRDPRAYHTVLGALGYVIPEVARPVFTQLIEQCLEERGRPITILDVGCSYGVNAALIRLGVPLHLLHERYAMPAIQRLSSRRLIDHDLRFFQAWPARPDVRFVGLDSSPEAIDYALSVGLIAEGAATDLELQPMTARLRQLLGSVDLIISTGCIGYVTERSFEKILTACAPEAMPWIASFVLRMFDFSRIDHVLTRHGLSTEKFDAGTFVQRRFQDRDEFTRTMEALEALGIDAAGKEASGSLHAELFVSRPLGCIETKPLKDMLSLTIGADQVDRDRSGTAHRMRSVIAA